jgi:hypothetical protein
MSVAFPMRRQLHEQPPRCLPKSANYFRQLAAACLSPVQLLWQPLMADQPSSLQKLPAMLLMLVATPLARRCSVVVAPFSTPRTAGS